MYELRPTSGRESARASRFARMGLACLASAGTHAAALLALHASGALGSLDRPRVWSVALEPLALAQWEANRGLAGAAPRPPDPPREIVALPPDAERDPAREERPPPGEVHRLAVRDQTVDKETVSLHAGSFARLLRVPQEASRGRRGSGERGEHAFAIPGREGPRGGGGTDADAAAPRPPAPERVAGAPAEPRPAPAGLPPLDSPLPVDGEGGQRIDGPRAAGAPPREYPRPEGGPSLDGEGLEEGPETRVHTRRFAPAAFWTDVSVRIHDHWEERARPLLAQMDPQEDTYFYKPRVVRVTIVLDASGALREVRVLESSRLDFYDDIVLAAVREKQPYPPPPPSALGEDGKARINMSFRWMPSVRTRALR